MGTIHKGQGYLLFKELRDRYVQRLRIAGDCFEAGLNASLANADDDKLKLLRDHAHRLAGSGATYGFERVTEAALCAEDSLDERLQTDGGEVNFVPDIEALHMAIREAIGSYDQEAPFTDKSWPAREVTANDAAPRILVVDDDPSVSDLLWSPLCRAGYDVEVVTDGIAAMASVKKTRPDLVLLDRNLPLLSGTSVLLELRQLEGEPIKTVILSVKPPSPWYQRQGIHYVQKPFLPQNVVALVQRLVPIQPRKVLYHG